eukprot:494886_1
MNDNISAKSQEKCDVDNAKQNEDIITRCTCLRRIIYSLQYYQLLQSSKSNGKDLFIQFCKTKYLSQCVDDYIHFICKHSNIGTINKITIDAENNHDLQRCQVIKSCCQTQRHFRNRSIEKHNINNEKYNFYIDMFDGLHFYLFHLTDFALRVDIKHVNHQIYNEDNKDDDIFYLNCIDKNIHYISQQIEFKRQQYQQYFHRLEYVNESKFVIQQFNAKEGLQDTFLDSMFQYMATSDVIDSKNLNELWEYVFFEEFDTDSIEMDIFSDQADCNLLYELNNNIRYVFHIVQFSKFYNVSNNAFQTGFSFAYHSFYNFKDSQTMLEFEIEQPYDNQNDFGGLAFNELYVSCHYHSIKEEALNSKYISMGQFNQNIVDKSNYFMETAKCKTIKCIHGKHGKIYKDPLHYDIPYAAKLKQEHLHSLLLYTDFSDFSSVFSATFRKIKWSETIKSVKKRNSKFANMAKYLKELVQYYGIRGYDENKQNGPFFTGISVCLNICSFSIRLHGPTSTSKQKEVAYRFATRDGIVLQMNNNKTIHGKNEVFFDCSWISAYAEEDERIFFGGRFLVELESIIIIKTRKNYKEIMTAFYKFDSMLSGQLMDIYGDVADIEAAVIDSFISYILGDMSIENKYDKYINENFYLFTKNKTKIVMDLHTMSGINPSFVGLVMHPIHKQKK